MPDTEALVDRLSIFGAEPESAADPAATSEEPDAPEERTFEDVLAELDGEAAPLDAAPAEEPEQEAAPAEPLTEREAELQRQLDEYKAREAEARAAQADEAFEERWANHWDYGLGWYQREADKIQRAGEAKGVPQVEIDAFIYNRVIRGVGLVDPQTGNPVVGQQQWERETAANEAAETAAYYRGKSAPSALDQMVSKYGLDDADRTSLAKFINYPPEHLEEIARTLGAKNQRTTSTLTQAQTQAATNVRNRLTSLANTTAPGTPGAPRPPKAAPLKGRARTEAVASHLMGYGD